MPHVELPQADLKVVLLGGSYTGKTSIAVRFAEGYYSEAGRNATLGASFVTKRYVLSRLSFWYLDRRETV